MIYSKTPLGLSYAIMQSPGKAAYCALSVKCGTRAEADTPEGTAHFVEHCLFKGTESRSAESINSRLDRLGGELNAYTTKEEIVLHATVLKEDIRKAIDLLLEIGTQATFPEDETEIEKGVVIDEIISYKDSPADDIVDKFEAMFFEGHPLGKLTLGTESSVKSITREDLVKYYRENFTPDSMVLSVVADEKEDRLERMVRDICAKYCTAESRTTRQSQPIPKHNCFNTREEKGNHEANYIIGAMAPSLYDGKRRMSAILLSNILGGPAGNSLLNTELREKHGWAYAADCSYTQYSDAGLISIGVGCDAENLDKCLKHTYRILRRLKDTPLSEARLKAAKKQLFGQLAISADSHENQCLSMGKSGLAFGRIIPDRESMDEINALTAYDLQSLAKELWQEGNYSQLIFV